MEPIRVTAFEIIFHSWALSNGEDFGTIKTFISAKGIIRTTFERGIKPTFRTLKHAFSA